MTEERLKQLSHVSFALFLLTLMLGLITTAAVFGAIWLLTLVLKWWADGGFEGSGEDDIGVLHMTSISQPDSWSGSSCDSSAGSGDSCGSGSAD